MKQFLNPRLKTYHNLINKYDTIDKEFPINRFLVNNLKVLVISYNTNKLDNLSFTTLLDSEFSSYKKISLSSKINQKSKITKFLLTLRSLFLYMYIELLIHSYFFNKNMLINQKQNSFIFVLPRKSCNIFLPAEFLSKLRNCDYGSRNTLLFLFFQYVNHDDLYKQLNYYFISP